MPTSGKESRRGLYREPCIPDIPYRVISSMPGLPGIPYTATIRYISCSFALDLGPVPPCVSIHLAALLPCTKDCYSKCTRRPIIAICKGLLFEVRLVYMRVLDCDSPEVFTVLRGEEYRISLILLRRVTY